VACDHWVACDRGRHRELAADQADRLRHDADSAYKPPISCPLVKRT
jgi:hypothetical protein